MRQVVNALKRWYPTEYELLRQLAKGDQRSLQATIRDQPHMAEHLQGYGLVSAATNEARISIGLVKDYLAAEPDPSSDFPEGLSGPEEVLSEIMWRRDPIERKLRVLLSTTPRIAYGNIKLLAAPWTASVRIAATFWPGMATKQCGKKLI